eukprot:scaffold122340_cov63-Phaeocystis_antarctica.AAC.3
MHRGNLADAPLAVLGAGGLRARTEPRRRGATGAARERRAGPRGGAGCRRRGDQGGAQAARGGAAARGGHSARRAARRGARRARRAGRDDAARTRRGAARVPDGRAARLRFRQARRAAGARPCLPRLLQRQARAAVRAALDARPYRVCLRGARAARGERNAAGRDCAGRRGDGGACGAVLDAAGGAGGSACPKDEGSGDAA